jgi:hypothetical protein
VTASARLVVLAQDDSMHANTGEPFFNESAYFNFYDPSLRLGGFVRIGNRPNEGYAEMTICLYLADGSVAFMFWRPEIEGNDQFDAAGLRFEVIAPLEKHRIEYEGTCCLLTRPLELLDPRGAFSSNPHVPVSLVLAYEAISPAVGGDAPELLPGFARGHLEQHGRAVGRVVIDGSSHEIDGFGLRDRSWGPRTWQALERYRWLTMNFGPDAGIAAALVSTRDGREQHGGYVWRAGEEVQPLSRVEIETEPDPASGLHRDVTAVLRCSDAAVRFEGRVLSMVPLRNRRDGVTTQIAEGLTEWSWDGRTGYGWSEYLDHRV